MIKGQGSGRIFVVEFKPTSDEELTEIPFSGREGQLGRKLIKEIFNENAYYTYLVKYTTKKIPKKIEMEVNKLILNEELVKNNPELLILFGMVTHNKLKYLDKIQYIKILKCHSLYQCLNSFKKLEENRRILCSVSLRK